MLRRVLILAAVAAAAVIATPSASAGGGCHWATAEWTHEDATASDEVTAYIAGCRFEPTTLFVEPGTTVTWTNKDPIPHSVTGPFLTMNGEGLLDQGDTASVTFDESGVYPYYCVLHYGMAASVVVGDPVDGDSNNAAAAPPVTGTYEQAPGNNTQESSSFPVAATAGIVAILGIAGAALLVRRRRRALPVPGALP